jgi:CRP/FNR family transcriptional regulator, cyclic AMP receptor protein
MPAVSLLEIEPDLGTWLSDEEQTLARRLLVPTVHLDSSSPELDRVLDDAGAFAALLIDGMVGHRMVVGGRQILRLLGPGDIIVHTWAPRSEILSDSSKRVENHAEVALLGRQLVNGARHFPGLIVGLHLRLGDQHQRLAVQIGICQLSRVQDRLLTMMWLLAESWGRVTPSGTTLPVKLTHSTLGELIGAKRPTVSLALRDLIQCGALQAQSDGWLLLSGPPAATTVAAPALTDRAAPATTDPLVVSLAQRP